MDFTLSEEQTEVAALAARILSDRCTPEALAEAEAGGDRFDADLWATLAGADLLGLCLPEVDGGGGFGVLEATLLCQEVGRTAAPVPLWSTLMLGALPVARHGSPALRADLLPRVAAGELVLTAALAEAGGSRPPAAPTTTAERADDGTWRLTGAKHQVHSAHLAAGTTGGAGATVGGTGVAVRMLVPATTDGTTSGNGATTGDPASRGSVTVFVVDPSADEVTVEPQVGPDLEPVSTVRLEGVVVGADAVVGEVGGGAAVVDTIVALGVAGICARQAGTCDAALRIAAAFTSERKQFGSPIATFQAVAHRLADAYIDTEGIRLTSLAAAWALDEGVPAEEALAVAKVWACDAGQRVVHGCQHVHGGIGVDTDYPLHRFFRAAKAAEHILGTVHPHLVDLGSRLVAEAPS